MTFAPRADRGGSPPAEGDASPLADRGAHLGAGRADLLCFAALVLAILATRAGAVAAGMSLDPTLVAALWQNLDPRTLADAPLASAAAMHAQPPLWNLLLAIPSVACGGEAGCVATAIWVLNVILAPVVAALVWAALRLCGAGRAAAWGAGALFALGPSALLYETFPLYGQTAAALAAAAALGLALLPARRGWGLGLIYGSAATLCWLWPLFHPLFVAVCLGAACLADRRAALSRAGLAAAALALAVAFAPSAVNLARHGMFTNGTWMGLNLAQTAPLDEATRADCAFARVIEGVEAAHPGVRDPLHHPDVIPRSKACLEASVAAILHDPLAWTGGRLDQLAASHSLWPYEFKYYHPTGWERLPVLDRTSADAGAIGPVASAILGGGILAWYAAIAVGAAGLMLAGRLGPAAGVAAGILLMLVCITGLAHAANGEEQNRMRHSLEPWWLILAAFCVEGARGRLRAPRRRPRGGGEAA